MAIVRSNSFESGQATGTAITNGSGGNSGAPAGNFLNAVFASANNSIQYHGTAMHGALAARMQAAGGGSVSIGYDDTGSTLQVTAMRGYFRWASLHTGNVVIMQTRGAEAGNTGIYARMTPEGRIQVVQASGAAVLATTADAVKLNTWYRVELRVTRAGDWALRVYEGDAYVLATPELSGSGATTGMAGPFTFWRWAMDGTAVNATQFVDDIAYGDDWIGPVPSGEARPIAVGSAGGWVAQGGGSLIGAMSDAFDTTFAESPGLSTTYQPMTSRLGAVAPGELVVRVRLSGDNKPDARVRLLQGTTVIATWILTFVPASPTEYNFALSAADAAKITDRADLWVETAGIL